jgi:magnesium chelatase family protein
MHVDVQRVEFDTLVSPELAESSAAVRLRVRSARQRQWRRFAEHPSVTCNAEMRVPEIRAFCQLDAAGSLLVREAVERFGLSARAYNRVLRLSRTIADVADSETIEPQHVAEAIQYQPRGRRA